ncbi:MAG: hypothetical protein M0R75_06815 [Dehalococcoidia bacterium]|nr:hypothetical protein [Dehalococcoidia bacterium]
MPAVTTDAPVGSAENPVLAVREGDWWRCGSCGGRFALGTEPTKVNNRTQHRCRVWNRMPIGEARE